LSLPQGRLDLDLRNEMKNFFYFFISIAVLTSTLLPQRKDSLIQLYPGIGDTLQTFDRNYFELFQNISGFESATFYIRYQDRLVSKIKYIKDNSFYDTTAIQSLAVLQSIRKQIENTLLKNDSVTYSQQETIVSTKDGKEYEGNLDMFSKTNLYLSEVEALQSEKDLNMNVSIPVNEVNTIILIGSSNVLYSTAVGVLAGGTFGAIIGFASGDEEGGFVNFQKEEKAFGLGVTFGLIGGTVGFMIGESEDDVVIKIDSKNDLLKLKDNAKYYFQYDKSIEEKYVELE
jgi:small nuclear ribonucleoprotein (snRNP)-like protein